MSGTYSYHYKQYLREKAEQEGIQKAYEELKTKPLEVIQRYKSHVIEYKWNHRSLIAKICYFPYVPVRFVAADKILDEAKGIERKLEN
jgi:hypothetical protein